MIRPVLTFWLLTLVASHAESLTRGYFIGKDQVRKWSLLEESLLNPAVDLDPFSGNATPRIEVAPPQSLEKPPFNSPLFREGDVLYDFKSYKKQLKKVQGKLEHAIYNETTGRIIVRGEPSSHWLFRSLAILMSEESPFNLIELNLEFQEEGQTILVTSARSLPGNTVITIAGENPQSHSRSTYFLGVHDRD